MSVSTSIVHKPWLLMGRRGSGSAPTLDLPFLGPTLDPRITFTRASAATYFDASGVMQTVGNNVTRFDYDPVTHVPLGLLIEETRTNLLLNSDTLGTQSVAVTAQAYTLSFYGTGTITKSGTATGALVGTGAFPQRVSQTFTPTAGTLTLTVTGSVLNAQLEAGAFPTSYIPTAGATVTRAADVATMALPGTWYNNAAGAFAADFITAQAAAAGTQAGVLRWDDGTANNNAGLWVNTTANLFAYAGAVANTAQLNSAVGSLNPAAVNRLAITYGSTNWASAGNGGSVVNGSGNTVLVAPSRLLLGSSSSTSTLWKLNGTLQRVRYWPRMLSNAELQSVTGEPSLNLSFFGPMLDPQITFTRASVGTYFDATGVMQTAASGAPRFDCDPVSRVPLGLLIEEARTNLVLQGNSLSGWTLSSATLTGNAGIAPNGTNSFNRIAETAVTNYHAVYVSYTVAASTTYSYSVFAKAAELRYLQLIYDDGGANGIFATFDLQTGTVSGAATARGTATLPSATISAAGSGIYRCTVSGQTPSTSGRTLIATSNAAAPGFLPSYAGNAANGLLVWGAQLEIGAFPTSYIPTAGATVTRQNDIAQILQTFNAPLSWVYETRHANNVNIQIVGGVSNAAGFNDTAYNSVPAAGNNSVLNCRVGGVGLPAPPSVPFPLNADNKIGATVTNNLRQTVSNGTATVVSDSTATTLPSYTKMVLLGAPWSPSTNVYNGWIRRARVWSRELSAAELVAATR